MRWKCKRRITIYFPEDWDLNEISELALELGNYFSLDCIRERAYKPRGTARIIRIYMNGSQMASGRSIKEVRAKFWSAWHKAKKYGVKL